MAIALAQTWPDPTSSSGGTLSVRSGPATTAGNLLICRVTTRTIGTIVTLTDDAANTWVEVGHASHGGGDQWLFYCENAASTTAVTVHLTASANHFSFLSEWSGVATSGALDTSAQAAFADATDFPPLPVTPTVDGCLIFGTAGSRVTNRTYAQKTPGYTDQTTLKTGQMTSLAAYLIQGTAATSGPEWDITAGSAIAQGQVTAAFKPAGGAPAPASGSASGTLTLAGTATGKRVTAGLAAGTLLLAGVALGASIHQGTASGTVARAGAAQGQTTHQGTAAGTLALDGAATGQAPATGASGTAVGTLTLAGTATGSTTHQGIAAGGILRAGTATGQAPSLTGASGTAVGTLTLAGTAQGATSHTGTATGAVELDGAAHGTTTHSGAASGAYTLDGVAHGISAPARDITVTATLGARRWAGSLTGRTTGSLTPRRWTGALDG